MPRRRLVVAIDVALMDQFLHLPPVFYSEALDADVLIHHAPQAHVSGLRLIKNFDLLITPDQTPLESTPRYQYWGDLVEKPEYVLQTRPSKLAQGIAINAAAAKHELLSHEKGFRAVGQYYSTDSKAKRGYSFGSDLPEKVVIKARDGARGVGQLLVDTTKVNVAHLLIDLGERTYPSSEALQTAYPGLELGSGNEHSDGESMGLLAGALVMQEYIPDVLSEYRLLVNPNGKIYALNRQLRKTTAFTQATGVSVQYQENRLTPLEEVDFWNDEADHGANIVKGPEASVVHAGIRTLLKELNFDYGSIDLFITNKRQWGFFEYCNQFGTVAYRPNEMMQFHQEAIEHWLKKLSEA